MKTIKVKTVCGNCWIHTTLANPNSIVGDYNNRKIQIRKIINVPDSVDTWHVIKMFNLTCDITGLDHKPPRYEFDFSELGIGKIITD